MIVMENKFPNIKTSGLLCRGSYIVLGWPEPHEFDLITKLRNSKHIRNWFLDNRPLDIDKNRIWLETGMLRPTEALLSIRLKEDEVFLGTIGWSEWNPISKTAWFGRIAVDIGAIKKIRNKFPLNYKGVAIEAALTLRDFAFYSMKLEAAFTCYLANNKLAARVNKSIGLVEIGRESIIQIDGSEVEIVKMKMTRQQFELLNDKRGGCFTDLIQFTGIK